jgi:hypothetical protein
LQKNPAPNIAKIRTVDPITIAAIAAIAPPDKADFEDPEVPFPAALVFDATLAPESEALLPGLELPVARVARAAEYLLTGEFLPAEL